MEQAKGVCLVLKELNKQCCSGYLFLCGNKQIDGITAKRKGKQQHEHKLLQSYTSQDKKLFYGYAMLCYAASLMSLLVFIVSAMFGLTCSPKFMTKLWLANGND
jgi:hypothetical protein